MPFIGPKPADTVLDSTLFADGSITSAKIADGNVTTAKLADQAVTLDKLPHGTSSNDGKFLRANNGADPTFESVASAEVYGFNTSGSQLQVTTTNSGADNISAATYASFDDVVFAATGFTFSLDLTTGNLVATI